MYTELTLAAQKQTRSCGTLAAISVKGGYGEISSDELIVLGVVRGSLPMNQLQRL